jgi:broad specificity phosphatase PhoE
MSETRFWMIRHALVAENARATLYGTMDVELCPHALERQKPTYAALARLLPQPAAWVVTPLSRTRRTAEAIFRGGYPDTAPAVEPGLIEQNLGDWQGLAHAALPAQLSRPAHPFWPIAGDETPPNGESFSALIHRVGAAMEALATAHDGQDVVVVSHGGAIRGAVAHAMGIGAQSALHLSVANLSLTRMERLYGDWRVVCINEMADYQFLG